MIQLQRVASNPPMRLAFAIAMLALLLTLTALVALYAQPVSSLGQFPVENAVAMKGDCP